MACAGASASDIAAIGITNQRETTVVRDRKSGVTICRTIVWQDRIFRPQISSDEQLGKIRRWKKAVAYTRNWENDD